MYQWWRPIHGYCLTLGCRKFFRYWSKSFIWSNKTFGPILIFWQLSRVKNYLTLRVDQRIKVSAGSASVTSVEFKIPSIITLVPLLNRKIDVMFKCASIQSLRSTGPINTSLKDFYNLLIRVVISQ